MRWLMWGYSGAPIKSGEFKIVMCKPYIDANGNRKGATEKDIREAEESARKFYNQ